MTDEFEGQENELDGPKALREAYERKSAEMQALSDQLAEAQKALRERSVVDSLKSKGLNERVAQFIPADADVDEWLTANSDLFAGAGGGASQEQAPAAPEAPVEPSPEQSQAHADFQRAAEIEQGSKESSNVSPVIQRLTEASDMGLQDFVQLAESLTRQRPGS